MLTADEIESMSAAIDASLPDTGTITRPGAPTFNASTGVLTPSAGTVIYSGKCRLRQPQAQSTDSQFGEQQITSSKFIACFPVDTTGVQIGDVVTFTECDDADVLARSFRITSIPVSTWPLYKGFPCEVDE